MTIRQIERHKNFIMVNGASKTSFRIYFGAGDIKEYEPKKYEFTFDSCLSVHRLSGNMVNMNIRATDRFGEKEPTSITDYELKRHAFLFHKFVEKYPNKLKLVFDGIFGESR